MMPGFQRRSGEDARKKASYSDSRTKWRDLDFRRGFSGTAGSFSGLGFGYFGARLRREPGPISTHPMMKNNSTAKADTPDQIVDQISRLMSEAESLMTGPAANQAGEKFNELRARFEQLQSRAGDVYADARKRVAAGAKVTDEAIRSHPYESLAVALGVGVLLGAVIGRRS